jgi:hypothetical protein
LCGKHHFISPLRRHRKLLCNGGGGADFSYLPPGGDVLFNSTADRPRLPPPPRAQSHFCRARAGGLARGEEINGAIYFSADIENDGRYGGYLRCRAVPLPHGGSADQRYGQISSERTVSNGNADKKERQRFRRRRSHYRRLPIFIRFFH